MLSNGPLAEADQIARAATAALKLLMTKVSHRRLVSAMGGKRTSANNQRYCSRWWRSLSLPQLSFNTRLTEDADTAFREGLDGDIEQEVSA